MSRIDPEQLLRELAILEEGNSALPSDAALAAYRTGSLSGDEAEAIEELLATSPAARQRLAELAEVSTSGPSAEARLGSLSGFGAQRSTASARAANRKSWAVPAWAAAASLVITSGAVFLMRSQDDFFLDEEARAADASSVDNGGVRSGDGERSDVAYVLPGQNLEAGLNVEDPVKGLAYAFYLRRGDLLERVWHDTSDDGGVRAVIPTKGWDPAVVERIYGVVARVGNLPPKIQLESGQTPREVLEDWYHGKARRLVDPLPIEWKIRKELEDAA